MLYYWLYVKNVWNDVKATVKRYEDGIETIEWIALAAVILALLMGMLFLMRPFGMSIGSQIVSQIRKWIGRW